jgi:hypothetical protein
MSPEEISKIEVAMAYLEKALEMPMKFKDYTKNVFSGPILAQLSKKNLMLLQDCRGVLKGLAGVGATSAAPPAAAPAPATVPAPAKPVPAKPAPETVSEEKLPAVSPQPPSVTVLPYNEPVPDPITVEIIWDAVDATCPVCGEVSTLGLTAKINKGKADARIELLVCGGCITLGKAPVNATKEAAPAPTHTPLEFPETSEPISK